MPLNEAAGIPRSTLTKKQKHEAMAALYGIQETPMDINQFSAQDIERMRAMVADHDKRTGPPKEFDLNNPPRENYRHQEWPTLLYGVNDEGKPTYKRVHSDDEMADALAAGWQKQPVSDEPELPALTANEVEEVAQIDAQLKKKKRAA